MRKRAILVLVCIICAICLMGCSSSGDTSENNTSSNATGNTSLENPQVEYTDADALGEATGFYIAVPEEATNVVFSSLDSGKLAQASFALDGVDIACRMKSTSEYEDISGMYYAWKNTETLKDAYDNDVILDYNENEAAAFTLYYRAVGISYSISMTADSLSRDKIMSLYDALVTADEESDRTI